MLPTEIGNVICDSRDAGCFQWIIDKPYFNLFHSRCEIASPNFRFAGVDCKMGISVDSTDQRLTVGFQKPHNSPPLNVKLALRYENKGETEIYTGELHGREYFRMGIWIQFPKCERKLDEIRFQTQLTVVCELTRLEVEQPSPVLQDETGSEDGVPQENKASDSDDETTIPDHKIVKKLLKDFKNLFISGEDSDVTIKVQNKEFRAHTIILRARSPVFMSMFSHEMIEKVSGVVVIDDCDPETFPDFLNYLYTGSTQHISHDNVCHLFTISDKYQVEELKEHCAAFMSSNLSVATFCDVLTLALRHSEGELIDLSTEFFCANATEITHTAAWQTFLGENSTVGNELFIKLLTRGKQP